MRKQSVCRKKRWVRCELSRRCRLASFSTSRRIFLNVASQLSLPSWNGRNACGTVATHVFREKFWHIFERWTFFWRARESKQLVASPQNRETTTSDDRSDISPQSFSESPPHPPTMFSLTCRHVTPFPSQLFIFYFSDDDHHAMTAAATMKQSATNSKTTEQVERKNRWKSKRERERNQARYRIRQRAVAEIDEDEDALAEVVPVDETAAVTLRAKYVEALEAHSVSTFSLRNLEAHRQIISQPIPVHLLNKRRYSEVSLSRFGEERQRELNNYLRPIEDGGVGCISILEYAALLGEYDCLKSFIVGGFDLVSSVGTTCTAANQDRLNRVLRSVSKRLLLDKNVPLTLSAYIVKAAVEMRMHGWSATNAGGGPCACQMCHQNVPLLGFGCHTFCELCYWEDVIGNIDERHSGDVLLCPICSEPYLNTCSDGTGAGPSLAADETSPLDRLRVSLERYNALPVDTKALRSLAKENKIPRRKTKRNTIHNNWLDAIIQTLGSSQEVRRDRYSRFIGAGDVHSVMCCLEAGVDVNMTNEYNQTPLYLACWRGHTEIIRLLLNWGADPTIRANGGMSCVNALKANGCYYDVSLLDSLLDHERIRSPPLKDRLMLGKVENGSADNTPGPTLTMLIDFDSIGDGAGAFYVDNAVPEAVLSKIDELFCSLPVDMSDKAVKQKKAKPCSKRSYFCDAEGALREKLEFVVKSVFKAGDACAKDILVQVYAEMRFLSYDEPSGWLAPHTDLSRTDPVSGKRSTHTFILYLTDSMSHGLEGGETALLASHTPGDAIAKVRPKRGRMFLFPHACLHEGCEVVSPPKIIIRGEALLELLK